MTQEITTLDLGGVNCYLLNTADGFILVDTGGGTMFGADPESIRLKLDAELECAGCKPGNLKLVILTHGDGDHSGNAAYIREKFKTKIAMHRADAEKVENPDAAKYMRSIKFRSLQYKILFPIITFLFQSKIKRNSARFERFKPDMCIDETFDLSNIGLNARILYLPGHTPGSIGILTASGDLISGDILANLQKPDIAPNATDFDVLRSSVEKLKRMDIHMVYPGHGKPFPMSQFLN